MVRMAAYMRVKEGMEEEYVRRHASVWPEVLAGITRYGIRNYTIFMHGRDLFSYYEVDNPAEVTRQAAADPINQAWQEYMAPLMDVGAGYREGATVYLDPVFHLP